MPSTLFIHGLLVEFLDVVWYTAEVEARARVWVCP